MNQPQKDTKVAAGRRPLIYSVAIFAFLVGITGFAIWKSVRNTSASFGEHQKAFDSCVEPGLSCEWSDVTLVVFNSDTGQPVPEYRYRYQIETENGLVDAAGADVWKEHKSQTGSIGISAPRSCEIHFEAEAPGFLHGFGRGRVTQPIRRSDSVRRVELQLTPGSTVRGIVVDETTRKLIPNAVIEPVSFFPPLFTGDRERAVKSDENGRFELAGVDRELGVEVSHADYFEQQLSFGEFNPRAVAANLLEIEIPMKMGAAVQGIVIDETGTPLAGVDVCSNCGKKTTTDEEGRFVLRSIYRSGEAKFAVVLSKDGYLRKTHIGSTSGTEKEIRLERVFRIQGNVLSSDGRPCKEFIASAGPGHNPLDFQCKTVRVASDDGRLELALQNPGEHWMSVQAPGHAIWEGWIDVQRNSGPVEVRLSSGSEVLGSVVRHGTNSGFSVRLIPVREDPESPIAAETMARKFATMETTVNADGSFRMQHVRPDNYTLVITDPSITPFHTTLTLGDQSVDVGTLRPAGTGQVTGVVFLPQLYRPQAGQVWAFADGELTHELLDEPIRFKADEHGKFEIAHAPIGKVRVAFGYLASADVVDSIFASCEVRENETVEVVVDDYEN